LIRRYTYGNGIDEQVAQEYKTNNGLVTVLPMYDSTGNMIGITDDTGKLLEKYSYSAFGMPEFEYDSAPPVIKNVHVIDGIVITGFSEPVNIGTVTNGMKVKHEGAVIQGTIEPGADVKEVKFTPSEPLPAGQMSLEIAETVEDETGNQMGSPFSNTFMYSGIPTIVQDDSAPEVDSIKKDLDGFKITFSERIDPYTITNSIEVKKTDGTVSGSITTVNERTCKFTPDEMLTSNQEYTLWVYSTLKDLSGKSINQFFHSFVVLPDDFLVYERPDPNKHVYSRIGNNYLFQGREYEPEVGLYFYRNRYYMPRIGRFLQTDPTGYMDSMNLYQAFGMNPINFIDPMGTLKFKSILKGVGAFAKNVAIGAAVVVGVAVTAPVSLPVAVAFGGGALTIGITNSISNRIADNQTSKQVVMGILPDMTGASALFAGGTGYEIITLEDLNLDEGQRAECIGGGLGQIAVICSAKWGFNKVKGYVAPKIKPYTENTFELIEQAFDALNSSQKGGSSTSIVPYDPVQFNAIIDSQGLTVQAEGRITGPHPGRAKGYVPDPVGGKSLSHHKGHLVPEGLVENPEVVNVKANIISEAAKSNLSPKRIFENLAGKIAKENPGAIVKTHHVPIRFPGSSVPYEVYHYITVNGKIVHAVTIKNQ
jgi:RHS repeat-associated protein